MWNHLSRATERGNFYLSLPSRITPCTSLQVADAVVYRSPSRNLPTLCSMNVPLLYECTHLLITGIYISRLLYLGTLSTKLLGLSMSMWPPLPVYVEWNHWVICSTWINVLAACLRLAKHIYSVVNNGWVLHLFHPCQHLVLSGVCIVPF